MAEDQTNEDVDSEMSRTPDIRDLISFRIHKLAISRERIGQRLFMERFGLSLPQFRVIGVVGALEPDAPVAEVLSELSMNKSQFSRELRVLMDRGLIVSTTDADDRRRHRVSLTRAGRRLHERTMRFAAERNDYAVRAISTEAAHTLLDSLETLIRWSEREIAGLGEESG